MVNRQSKIQFNHEDTPATKNGGSSISAQAFRELHDNYRDRLVNSMTVRVRNRETAEDITSTAFATAFENLAQFRGDASLYTWVHAIALNEARQWTRRNRGVSLEALESPNGKELCEPAILDETLNHSECGEEVRRALRRVPALYRRLLVDHFICGYSVKQISRRERVPVGTVLSRIFNAKRLLREAWG
jgi:RNA polymerase sigma-70 factor (ECF subfamily)